jgi:hypothetical protein
MIRPLGIGIVLLAGIPAFAETLNYSINWASGLSLGEGTLQSNESKGTEAEAAWSFALDLDVSVPGFSIRDEYASTASAAFCSEKLSKTVMRGTRKFEERIKFDQEKQAVTRETVGGGKTELSVSACARDALTFLQFVRKELASGRLAPRQTVVFGAPYEVRFDYAGVQHVQVGRERLEAERIQATIKGPASDVTVEVYFARDAARTPVLARIPSPLGAFVVELMR